VPARGLHDLQEDQEGAKQTTKVRGWKAHRKQMKKGAKIRACPKPKKKKKNR
jgi:hypothetical protein